MKEINSNLEQLGFSPNEARVFLVLMQGKTMTAGEIAEEAKISRPSAYDILKAFTEKGFCNEIETPTKLWYEVIDPEVIIDKIRRDIGQVYKTNLKHLDDSAEKLKSFYKTSHDEKKKLDIELLRGFNKHRTAKFLELIKEADKEILLMNSLSGSVSKELDEETNSFLSRGGVFKAIYELNSTVKMKIENEWKVLDKKEFLELCEFFESLGAQTHLIDKIPQNVMIIDRNTVFLNVVNEDKSKNDIIIRNKKLAEFMATTFDELWERSQSIKQAKKLSV